MNNRIKFIKKQKESFNNNVSYINVKSEEEILDEQLQHITDPLLRENFKEGIFKAIRRAISKAVKGFASLGDAMKGVNLNKVIVDPVKNEFNSAFNDVTNVFNDIGDDINDMANKTKKSFVKSVNVLRDTIKRSILKTFDPTAGIKDVIKEFNKMVKFFKTVPRRVNNVFDGVGGIFYGIGEIIEGIGKSIGLGFYEIGLLFAYIGEFITTYLECIVKMLVNLWSCFFYYIVEMFLQILYLPVRIMLWVSKHIFGQDLYDREKQAFDGLYDMSYLMYKYTGYHFMYWPKPIRERCFVCVRLKTSTVSRKAKEVDEKFSKDIPGYIKKGEYTINRGVFDILKAGN
jgi:hypothetical protein